jgi:hypothetical protein
MELVTSPSLYIVRGEDPQDGGKAFADYRDAKSYARVASRVFGLYRFTVSTEQGRPIVRFYQGKATQ